MMEDKYYELKTELRSILLCFLKDTQLAKANAAEQISDDRIVQYNQEALSDTLTCIMPLIVHR